MREWGAILWEHPWLMGLGFLGVVLVGLCMYWEVTMTDMDEKEK